MEAHIEAWIDQYDAQVAASVRRRGWFIPYVGGTACDTPGCDHPPTDEPPFAYTVGLFGLAHPELLIFDVTPESAVSVLNRLGDLVRAGVPLLPGRMIESDDWPHRIIPEVVPNPGQIVFEANRYYQRPDECSVPVLQLSYDDEQGKFPWEEGYAHPDRQPRPGTFSA